MNISANKKTQNFASVPNLPNGYGDSSSFPQGTQSHPNIKTDNLGSDVRQHHVRIQEDGNGRDLDGPNTPRRLDSNAIEDDEDHIINTRDNSCCVPTGCSGPNRRPVPANLNFVQRVVIGSGHILNDLCASLWFSYLLLYLEKVVGFSSTSSAALLLLGQVKSLKI